MGFLDPRKLQEDDALPGSDLHVDLEAKLCTECRREALPWETQCRDCGGATARPSELPATEVTLPDLGEPDPGEEETEIAGTDTAVHSDTDAAAGDEPDEGS